MLQLLRRVGLLLAAAVLALGTAACGSDDDASSQGQDVAQEGANPQLEGEITIGAVLPLTGASATIGKDQQRGIELAVKKINASGGVLGKRIAVKVEDSEGASAPALNAARKLVSVDKVPVVIGEYSSGNTIPVGEYLQRQKVVHINPGSSSPDIAEIGDYSFSTIGLDTIAGRFTGERLAAAGYKTAAFLAPNNAYGSGVLEYTKKAFEDAGGKVVEEVLYTEGRSDYRQELQRIKQANADVVIYSAYGTEAATINKQAFELGMDAKKFFAIYLTMCTADADEQAVEGQQGMDVNYIGPGGEDYQQAYQEEYGEGFRTSFSGYTYDAVMMVAQAINEAGSADPDKIRDALAEMTSFEGVTGTIAFDEDGQRKDQPYLLAVMKDGKVEQEDEIVGPGA